MSQISFKVPLRGKIIEKIAGLPVAGRPIQPKKPYPCSLCRRAITGLGRLPHPGFPTCSERRCEVTQISALTKIFPTSYGCALHVDILSIFTRVFDLEERTFLERTPIVDRAELLADGYVELLTWQKTFDLYERHHNPDRYDRGGVTLIPPRRIDEVLAFRATAAPELIDPTRRYGDETQRVLHRMKKKGSAGFEVPF